MIRVTTGRTTGITQTGVQETVSAYDPDRSFLVIQGRGNENSTQPPQRWAVSAVLDPGGDNTKVQFRIGDSDNPSDAVGEATWALVEALDGEFRVTQVSHTLSDGSDDVDLSSLGAPFDLARTMVIISTRATYTGTTPNTAQSEAMFVQAFLADDSTLRLSRTNDLVVNTQTTSFVVEWAEDTGVTVEAVQRTDTFNNTEEFFGLSGGDIDDNLSWLFVSALHATTTINGCSVRYELDYAGDDLGHRRHSTTNGSSSMAANVLRFPSGRGIRAAYGEASAADTDATEVITLNRAVHAASSIVFLSNSCPGNTAGFARQLWTYEFTSIDGDGMSDEITVDRDYTPNACDITVHVLDFSEAELLPAAGQNLMMGHFA